LARLFNALIKAYRQLSLKAVERCVLDEC
jgi:hypothetical protein